MFTSCVLFYHIMCLVKFSVMYCVITAVADTVMNYLMRSIRDVMALLKQRALSSLELCEAALQRQETAARLQAFITCTSKHAREAAFHSQKRYVCTFELYRIYFLVLQKVFKWLVLCHELRAKEGPWNSL